MASITCRHGGTPHTHYSVPEVRKCQGFVATYIDNLPDVPVKPTAEQVVEQSERTGGFRVGVYQSDSGQIYKVQISRTSGRPYALALVEEEGEDPRWEYAKGAIYNLTPNDIAPAEVASKFGAKYSNCINCFQELSRGESVRRGYGPTCADNHGWEYNHSSTD